MKSVLSPYLTFDGQTKAAMEFYKSIFDGELKMQTFGESGMPCGPDEKERIIHAELKNDTLSFMASDSTKENPVHVGDNISLSIAGDDEATLTGYFSKLAAGGKVTFPLKKEFWGDTFGMLVDQFGVHWLVNISTPKTDQ